RGQRHISEDHHDRHGKKRPAGAGEAGAEARRGADAGEQYLLAGAPAVALGRARWLRQENVQAGGNDDQRDDDAERPRVDQRRGARAEEAEDHRAGAHRPGNAPVDAAPALVKPGADDAGEEESEERCRGRLVDREAAEQREKGNQHDAADADRADQQADERRDRRDGNEGAQPAAKATSSLVSSTASFFIKRKPRSLSASIRRLSAAPSIATTSHAVRQ